MSLFGNNEFKTRFNALTAAVARLDKYAPGEVPAQEIAELRRAADAFESDDQATRAERDKWVNKNCGFFDVKCKIEKPRKIEELTERSSGNVLFLATLAATNEYFGNDRRLGRRVAEWEAPLAQFSAEAGAALDKLRRGQGGAAELEAALQGLARTVKALKQEAGQDEAVVADLKGDVTQFDKHADKGEEREALAFAKTRVERLGAETSAQRRLTSEAVAQLRPLVIGQLTFDPAHAGRGLPGLQVELQTWTTVAEAAAPVRDAGAKLARLVGDYARALADQAELPSRLRELQIEERYARESVERERGALSMVEMQYRARISNLEREAASIDFELDRVFPFGLNDTMAGFRIDALRRELLSATTTPERRMAAQREINDLTARRARYAALVHQAHAVRAELSNTRAIVHNARAACEQAERRYNEVLGTLQSTQSQLDAAQRTVAGASADIGGQARTFNAALGGFHAALKAANLPDDVKNRMALVSLGAGQPFDAGGIRPEIDALISASGLVQLQSFAGVLQAEAAGRSSGAVTQRDQLAGQVEQVIGQRLAELVGGA